MGVRTQLLGSKEPMVVVVSDFSSSPVLSQCLISSADYQAVQYESGTANEVFPGLLLQFDTNPLDTQVGTYVSNQFNPCCYPSGTFPAGVC